MEPQKCDLVVIGGGPGGYAAAFRAADLGKSVTIVDRREHLGGVCLLEGCIPSKAMIGAAELLDRIRHADRMGIKVGDVSVQMDRLAQWRDGVVKQLVSGVELLAKQRGVTWLRGEAAFIDPHRLRVSGGETAELSFDYAVIAAGAESVFPAGLAPDGRRIIGSRQALALAELPGSLLVVGGGYIGLELGSCFAILGSRVTVVEMCDQLLPGTDADLVRVVRKELEGRGVEILLSTTLAEAKSADNHVDVLIRPGGQKPTARPFDYVLVSVGRAPATAGLDLDRAGVTANAKGFIQVDAQCRTTTPHIFAVGDCSGGLLLAHKARRQGIVAAEVICGQPAAFDNRTVPAVVFSSPEIAYCGLSEEEASAAGHRVRVGRFPWRASSRAAMLDVAEGFVKVIADADSDVVLGVRMVGPHVSELIAEATLAIEAEARVEDVLHTIHVHPTLSESLEEAAEAVHGAAIHFYREKR